MPKEIPKFLKQLTSLITPSKGVKQKNPADNNAPEDEGIKVHDCDGDKIPVIEQIEEEEEVECELGEEEGTHCPLEHAAANARHWNLSQQKLLKFSIPKLVPLCSDKNEDNAKLADEMGDLLLKFATSNRIGCFTQNILQHPSKTTG